MKLKKIMTALEFFEKQLKKTQISYDKEKSRGANENDLHNIQLKIGYYEEAIAALKIATTKQN